MRFRVRLTARAEADIEQVLAWFASQQAYRAGQRWLSQLMTRVSTLENHPQRCALAAESADLGIEIRKLAFGGRQGRYRILFQIVRRQVYILRVWHAARDKVSREEILEGFK